jgi:hypothetical protein
MHIVEFLTALEAVINPWIQVLISKDMIMMNVAMILCRKICFVKKFFSNHVVTLQIGLVKTLACCVTSVNRFLMVRVARKYA